MLLERRSLIVIKDRMYDTFWHGIDATSRDVIDRSVFNLKQCPKRNVGQVIERGIRVSLTIRNVPKVAKYSVASLFAK